MLLNLKELQKKYNLQITGIIHIGAHYGNEYETYKLLNIKKVIFFEPLKKTYNILFEKFKNNKDIKTYNLALGNYNKKSVMFVENNNEGQSSSLLEPHYHKAQYPNIIFSQQEEVQERRLDDLNIDDIKEFNMINIDVQGYELEVFKGSENIIKNNIKYIICEVNRSELYKDCAFVTEIDEFLGKHGFARVETSWEGVTWGDALYVKN